MLTRNQMQYNSINLSQLNFKKSYCFKTYNKTLGLLHTKNKKYDAFIDIYTTKLLNKNNIALGQETFLLTKNKLSYGMNIDILPEYQQKGYNLGELLRLSSIIMMLENKIKVFKIFSLPEALFFHNKYKFTSDIDDYDEMISTLENSLTNCKNKKEYKDIYNESNAILDASKKAKDQENLHLDLMKKTNDLINRYFNKISNKKDEYKNHPFKFGIHMKLTMENILKNKDFFNELFKKHKINYVIK